MPMPLGRCGGCRFAGISSAAGPRVFSFATETRFILIDQGLGVEPISEFLIDMLRAEGKTETTIHCLQTHFHDDHIGGAAVELAVFSERFDAAVS